jgi:tRNA A37 threonylcarbamoyltransferase TsaD
MATFELPLFFAPLRLCSDNAVMIGLHALLHGPISREMLFRNGRDGFSMQPFTRYTEDELERRR